jgi:hypothetical protein
MHIPKPKFKPGDVVWFIEKPYPSFRETITGFQIESSRSVDDIWYHKNFHHNVPESCLFSSFEQAMGYLNNK